MNQILFNASQIATVLKNRRHELGITQKDAANKVGLYQKTVSLMENEPERCSVDSMIKYLSALDLGIVFKKKESLSETTEW